MIKCSAGILLFRWQSTELEVLLVHPGGPFWAKKEAGAWSIPKGEHSEDEHALTAAKREFAEETGVAVEGEFIPLGEVKQAGGKLVRAWALEGDLNASLIRSNTFTLLGGLKPVEEQFLLIIDSGTTSIVTMHSMIIGEKVTSPSCFKITPNSAWVDGRMGPEQTVH